MVMTDKSKIINLFKHKKDKTTPKEIPKEFNIAINVVDGKVVLAFREPVKSLMFTRQQAIKIANIFISAACDKSVI